MAETYIFWKKTCRHYSIVSFEVILMDCDMSGCHYKHADELVALLDFWGYARKAEARFSAWLQEAQKNRNNWEGIWGRINRIDSKTMRLRVMERFICPTFKSNGSVIRDMGRTLWMKVDVKSGTNLSPTYLNVFLLLCLDPSCPSMWSISFKHPWLPLLQAGSCHLVHSWENRTLSGLSNEASAGVNK